MGDLEIKCPLCCDKTFNSKSELIDHLAVFIGGVTCSVCNKKCSSIEHLIEHLSLDNCQPQNSVPTLTLQNNTKIEIAENDRNATDLLKPASQKDLSDPMTVNDNIDDGTNIERMYVEFLSKQLTKPCLQTQELKLVKDDGGISRYVFVTNDNNEDIDIDSAVVTKQNNDGTISLTTVGDMKMESDQPLMQEMEEIQEEIYSCNTCGVSFTSVQEHIQNYHNDQDVVVEEPVEEMDIASSMPLQFEEQANTVTTMAPTERQLLRRMITETGDIIEEPATVKTGTFTVMDPLSMPDLPPAAPVSVKQEPLEKKPKQRRYVVIDSVVKKINQPDAKCGPYHKVVIKEMQKSDGAKVKIFNCMSCHIYVTTLEEFKSHPCKQLRYTCAHCPVSYENSKSLCAHMKIHKPKAQEDPQSPVTVYSCQICNTTFNTNKSLKLHKRMHDPVKTRPIEPPVVTPDGTEASKDKFLCSVCNKLIPIDYRAVHQKSHREKNDFNCDICNKEFQSAEYLEMHMSVHLNEKVSTGRQDKSLPYTCLYCERRFSRPHEKVKHERIHTGEKPHSCEICGKSFRVSYCLTLHMRTHTGARPYACNICGKRFKAHSVYNHHLLTHSEVRAYKCPYCPKAFKTSVQLAGHKNSHTKPFSCQHCNRPFASLYAVRVHTETHAKQNSLKFSCTLCGASYARAFALKDHIKAVHKKDAGKEEIDKALSSMWEQQKDVELPPMNKCDEEWVLESTVEDNGTEITIESKSLAQDVDINVGSLEGYSISNELVVP